MENCRPDVPDVRLLGVFVEATAMVVCPTAENAKSATDSISVYLDAETGVVTTAAPLRDWSVKAYCVFGDRPKNAYGELLCCHEEVTIGSVVFTNCTPELPMPRLLGVLVDATLMAVSPTLENVNPEQAWISVQSE